MGINTKCYTVHVHNTSNHQYQLILECSQRAHSWTACYTTITNVLNSTQLNYVLQITNWWTLRHILYAGQMLCVHSPDGSTFLHEMTSWLPSWNYDIISEFRVRQSMCIYFDEQSGQTSSRSILKQRSLRLWLKRSS